MNSPDYFHQPMHTKTHKRNLPMNPKYREVSYQGEKSYKFPMDRDPMRNFTILANHARWLYRENEISGAVYIKLIQFIGPLCIEQMIEDKVNEIIPTWSKRFSHWLQPMLEETS